MIGENQLVTNEPVEVELKFMTAGKLPTILEKSIEYIYPNLVKEYRRMSTCHRLDLQTLGS